MNDTRIKFFINISGCYLGTTFLEDTWEKDILGLTVLKDFLDNSNINIVFSYIEEIELCKRLKFCANAPTDVTDKFVNFSKIKPGTINLENTTDLVQVTSVSGSPMLALYNTLNNVFSPILKDDDTGLLKKQILNLQADLRSSLLTSENSDNDFINKTDDYSLFVVRTLDHELEYWNNTIKNSKGGINRSTSTAFRDILEPFVKDFRMIDTMTPDEVEEVLETGHNALDDLWRHKPPYHVDRMKNLMDIVGNGIYIYSVRQLKTVDILTEEFGTMSDLIAQHVSLGEKWLTSCTHLTQIFWSNNSDHMWEEEPYEVIDLKNFVNRLKEILSIRTIHKQLMRLLTTEEQERLDAGTMFSPFKDLNLYSCGKHTEIEWIKSRKEFEQLLQPAEQKVGSKLKRQLSSINANTRQLLYEFSRYSELISRPLLKHSLLTERQYLLSALFDYVRQLQTQTSADISYYAANSDTPLIIRELMMTRQLESRAKEVQETSGLLLSDLQNFENLNAMVIELLKDLKKQHTELFDSWTSEITTRINDNSLSLRESDPVIQFSKDKLMKVNYSPRLVLLISEVRQLGALGYNVPSNIYETAEHAKKFMNYAKILEQIANFHNTIGDRMIVSQRPMMLKSAMDLWKLVEEQEVVSWGDTKSIEVYVDTLKKVIEDLSAQNNLLASYHFKIIEKINGLTEFDLVTQYSKWKEAVKGIKNIIFQVEEKGFQNMHTWINDISKQLAKVLEKQYLKSLDKLHLYLPEIHADLIYRNSKLQFSPSENELKNKYEQQMQKFLDIPKNFYAMFEFGTNIFHEIVERSKTELDKTTHHMTELFNQLQEVIKYWQSWLQIGELEVSKLTMWQHWDLHFKVSKTFGQEIAKLPSTEEKVGCFIISLSRLRSDLESHNRSYWDQLASSLKDSIAQDVVNLQNYIDPSTATLTKQSVTLEEIAESGVIHLNILKQVPEMEKIYGEMIMKAQVLSSWTREQVDSVNRLKGAWERLKSLLENHQHIVAKQMETIKTTLNIEGENINKEMERFAAKWEQAKPKAFGGEIADKNIGELYKQLQNMKEKKTQWEDLIQSQKKLIADYEKYDLSPNEFPLAEDIEKDIENVFKSWKLFEDYHESLSEFNEEDWIVFRKKMFKFEEFLQEWQNKLFSMEQNDIVVKIIQENNKFGEMYPVLKYVRGDDFTEKHWMDVFSIIEISPKPVETLKLKDFLDVSDRIKARYTELQAISKKAASEIVVRQALAELDSWDVQAKFILTEQKDSLGKSLMIIKDFKELLNKIGDHQSLLQSVKNSADYESFSERAGLWETKLIDLDFYLSSLMHIQRKWLYLEPIFGSGTLDYEKSRFEKANKDIRYLFSYITKDARVSTLYRFSNLRSLLENLQDQFSRCQQSLDNFLAEKRDTFPRFYFLGDDDLLEVVGQSSKEQVIQSHLKKIFSGINNIKVNETGENIVAICSLEGERVPLTNVVNITRPVEEWLSNLVKEMNVTLKDLLVQCLEAGQNVDPLKYPSQILCLASNITFTLQCEQCIANMNLPPLLAKYKTRLAHYNSLEVDFKLEKIVDEETNVLELKLKALILDTIHQISILKELLAANITKVTEWSWQKQLRFYSNSLGEVTVKMANARMDYAYEYLGNATQLVRTPLTEQCFITLTQGMHLGMGGNPYGPAGTGKTESVKALGALLGRQVLVFNCDEGIDAASMARILSGLVRSGAWGCFDEFNRLEEATLSAISTYIHSIHEALKSNQETLTILDQKMKVNKHCSIFVTLNPAGGSYGGRNKLPDNLKQLFRPIVMTHPNHELIAKSLLLCEGYQNADTIGRKLIEVFSLASKILSKQQHYDWGLRAIKTILTSCGRTKKQFIKSSNKNVIDVNVEMSLVVNILKSDTMSKLTFSDSQKFENIIQQVFKDVEMQNIGDEVLMKALQESFLELGLIPNEKQIVKCVELYGQLQQRMGVAIVGPPSSGKSTVRNLLRKALLKMNKNIVQHVFNPKSVSRSQLLGQIEADTRQWNDGILTKLSLQVTSESSDIWSWIVCDGDVDPEWVESLNSVLDDNRLLTLPSGWRIQFGSNVNFIFETHNLDQASPATISRMGIVLLSEKDFKVQDYIDNFVNSKSEDFKRNIGPVIEQYFLKCIDWIENEGEITIPCSTLSKVKSGLSQLLDVTNKRGFIVGVINGLGQLLQNDFRELFAQEVFDWLKENPPPLILKPHYNSDRDMIDTYETNPNLSIEDSNGQLSLIEIGQIVQTLDVLSVWVNQELDNHILLVGPHGSAKSLIIKKLVDNTDADLIVFNCSTTMQPSFVISKMSQYCISVNTNKGKTYKPKKGRLFLHFKNMQLLKPDKWGTNILIEFLHQLITYKAFFDSNLEAVTLEKVTIIGSMSSTSKLSCRFTSIVNIYNVDLPQQEDLIIIMSSYLQTVLKKSLHNERAWPKIKIAKLMSVLMLTYDEIRSNFSSVQHKHYNFSPHDLVKWCSSILVYQRDQSDENSEIFLIKILCFEAFKLFGDKLVNENDLNRFKEILISNFQRVYEVSNIIQNIFKYFYVPLPGGHKSASNKSLSKLTMEEWATTVERGKIQYEREGGHNLDIIICKDLLFLSASVAKAVNVQGGHLMMVGQSGIGRRAAVKISSALYSAKLVIPVSGNQPQLNNDLKYAFQQAGIEGEEVYLLLEDHILKGEEILSVFNTIILSGEVPGLYNTTELNSLVMGLGDEMSRANFEGTLVNFFSERIKRHLHIIACLDKNNQDLQIIFDNCPAFIFNSTIIWKDKLSEESIVNLPKMMIERFNSNENNLKIESTEYFTNIFNIADEKVRNPRRYVQLVQIYLNVYQEKISGILSKQSKLKAGVAKLTEAKNLVSELKQKAAVQEERLAEKQKKANVALDMISNTMKNANVHKEQMESLKLKTEEENQYLIKRKKEIELELSEVEPLIQEARAAVGKIKSESLTEIRSLRAPPEVIRDILEGVLRLMGIQDTSWNSMKNFLAKRGVKEDIRSFDAGRINPENRQAVERLMSMKGESFNPASAKRASVAAAPLAAWVSANVKYSHVVEKIKPLEKEQYKLKQNLSSAEVQLGELNADLSDVDVTVAKLKAQLSAYTKEAAEIEIDLNKARDTLATAEDLVDKLNDEFERWQEQLKEMSVEVQKLPNNCLLSSAYVTYLTGEYENERRTFLKKCLKEVGVDLYDFEQFMSTKREQMQWQGEGLPNDKLSIQNAIMITKADIIPLLIDPTSQAINWIKKNLKHKQVECLTQDTPNFHNTTELAVRFGKVLIIEEVNHISPLLLSISRKQFTHQGDRRLISLNGKLVDYHNDFKLILSTRDEHLKIPPDCSSFVSVMNFTITHAGFTEQLISSTIKQENPQLEERKKDLVRKTEELQQQQFQLQEQLLEDMANSTGDILQNKKLIESLNETKATFLAVSKSILEQEEIEKKLENEYDVYRNLSAFGSALFFAVNEFSNYNVLYAISASVYTRLFLKSVESFQSMANNTDLQKNHLMDTVYSFLARGIFKEDRIKFGLHLMQRMFPEKIPPNEWKVFLQYSMTDSKPDSQSIPDWVPKKLAFGLQNFQTGMPGLFSDLRLSEETLWRDFMVSDSCESRIPNHCKLTEFQRVLLIQALRPDRLYAAISQCTNHLADPSVLDLLQIYKESVCSEPILLMTTSGNDPSNEIRELATSLQIENYYEVAMGEGQETRAITALQKASKSGHWIVLKNLHLVVNWLSILCQNLQINHHENFRLWMITEPNANFNFVLAQNSLKVVYEAPKGLKYNLQRTYNTWGAKYVEKLQTNSAKIFFVIACLHAILQERRTYIPQGWSKWYEFSDIDFTTCVKLLEDIWSSSSIQVPWKIIRGLCSSAVYGGRIENIDDLEILESYLRQFCNDEILSHRWRPFGLKISLPSSSNFDDYLRLIMELPSKELPELFGLPKNIDRAWQMQKSSEIVRDSKSLHLPKTISAQFQLDSWCKGLNPFLQLWKKLNQGHDFVKMSLSELKYSGSPVSIFLAEEFQNAILLIQKIHKCFTALNRICKKVMVAENEHLVLGNSLLGYMTPKIWQDSWEGPTEPTKYLRTIFIKIAKLSEWKNQNVRDLLSKPVSLSTLFRPEAFLASYKLEFSSEHNIPLDDLALLTQWKPRQSSSLILSDLLIECAVFDGNALKMCNSNSDNINNVPNCYISWRDKKSLFEQNDELEIPLFSTSSRSNKLTTLQVPCKPSEKDNWIRAGVAFFLEI